MERLLGFIGLEDATQEVAEGTSSMRSMNEFMAIFMIIIGIFIMYSAITGKGPAYKNDYPKAMQEDYHKMLRKFCWFVGPVALAAGILDYMQIDLGFWISFAIIIPAVVVFIVIFRKRFKKYL